MHRNLKIALFVLVGSSGFSALAGCKISSCAESTADGGTATNGNCIQIEPTVEYRDARPRTASQSWSAGSDVSVTNHNGKLKVDVDSSLENKILVTGIAFTRDGSSQADQDKAKARLQAMPDPTALIGAGGAIIIDAPGGGINGSNIYNGYDLTVHLPPAFDGTLTIDNQNGDLELHGADNTKRTIAKSHDINADNLRNFIDLTSTIGDIEVSATPSGPGNVIRAEFGDISARIGMANLLITAQAKAGTLTFPAAWTMQSVSSDHRSGTATLGDGTGSLSITADNIAFAP